MATKIPGIMKNTSTFSPLVFTIGIAIIGYTEAAKPPIVIKIDKLLPLDFFPSFIAIAEPNG